MKIRQGFVSNSSSTSFIVSASEKTVAEELGLELISIKDIKECLNRVDKLSIDFIVNCKWETSEIKEMNDEDFISQPFDRDRAYQLGICYPTFMEDL